jgi:hypothetical protein
MGELEVQFPRSVFEFIFVKQAAKYLCILVSLTAIW